MSNTPRIMFVAPKSGCGKTTITCAFLKALLNKNITPSSFKCGPDYIDPLFHKKVIGVFSTNLDLFFSSESDVNALLKKHSKGCDIAVLEGVMGYYDGLAGVSERASSYHLATVTATPAILILDAKGASLSLSATIKGFLMFRNDSKIKGVILNNCSQMLYSLLKESIEKETNIKVLGYFPSMADCNFKSRHLGLVTAEEIIDIKQKISKLGETFERTVDIEGLIEIANSAENLEETLEILLPIATNSPVVAVAEDTAFCFYYEQNLNILRELGAVIKKFSPLNDSEIPKDASALYLGGGYPEVYAKELSANASMIESIKTAANNKIPIFAECGGFLYLHKRLENLGNDFLPMVGLFENDAFKTEKLSRFGYVTLTPKKENKWLEGDIKAHEFHYWDSAIAGEDLTATKPITERSWDCGHITDNIFAGFAHLYFQSNICFAKNFVKKAEEYRTKNGIE